MPWVSGLPLDPDILIFTGNMRDRRYQNAGEKIQRAIKAMTSAIPNDRFAPGVERHRGERAAVQDMVGRNLVAAPPGGCGGAVPQVARRAEKPGGTALRLPSLFCRILSFFLVRVSPISRRKSLQWCGWGFFAYC